MCASKVAAGTSAVYVRVSTALLAEFDNTAQQQGMSRSEAIREAMKLFIRYARLPHAKSLKGVIIGSKLDSSTLLDQVAP